ncbi:MAG TPA: hypothetical protein VGF94_19345 [Kofleriaceae bacterium]|jgi:hypothetical protein
MRAFLFALAVAATGCVANPQPRSPGGPPGTTQPQQASRASHGDQVICHEVADTGSMFSHTECTTIDEQRERNEETERVLRHQNGGMSVAPK